VAFDLKEYRIHHVFIHDLAEYRIVHADFRYRIDVPNTEHGEILRRLIEYYHRMNLGENNRLNDDVWKKLYDKYYLFTRFLELRDTETISKMLLDFGNTELVTCFENCLHHAEHYSRANQSQTDYLIYNIVDKYLALGSFCGCVRIQNPEQGSWGCSSLDLRQLHDLIQGSIPFDMTPPNVGGGVIGFMSPQGIVSEKNLEAIYTANKVRDLLGDARGKKVCEIGGGIGNLAYYLVKSGVHEVSSYELPVVSTIQGYFLAKSLGQENIWFWGEPERPAKVKIFPYWTMGETPDHYALAINQDSLPEIEESVSAGILGIIKEKADMFLSINQESNPIVVSTLASKVGFRRTQRHKYWMREGYAEEVYII
jgi:hypothetical protein